MPSPMDKDTKSSCVGLLLLDVMDSVLWTVVAFYIVAIIPSNFKLAICFKNICIAVMLTMNCVSKTDSKLKDVCMP